jgi:hypothetical protein
MSIEMDMLTKEAQHVADFFRVCCVCGELHEREAMSQCGTCDQFMCTRHDCGCPVAVFDSAAIRAMLSAEDLARIDSLASAPAED